MDILTEHGIRTGMATEQQLSVAAERARTAAERDESPERAAGGHLLSRLRRPLPGSSRPALR